jgi:two-component sensor histidine kinase
MPLPRWWLMKSPPVNVATYRGAVAEHVMAAWIRAYDWSKTSLGPMDAWPGSLKVAVDIALGCEFPMVVLWGPERIRLYNDGYRLLMADKHPGALGRPARACWPQAWAFHEAICQRVGWGESVTCRNQRLRVVRHGAPEDAWFTLCYSPLRDESGAIAGVMVTALEVGSPGLPTPGAELGGGVAQATERTDSAVERECPEAARCTGGDWYRCLFNSIDEGFCTIEMLFGANGSPFDYRFLETNRAFARQTELADANGRTIREMVPDHEQYWFDTFGRIATTGKPERFEHEAGALGHHYEVYAFRIGEPEQRRIAVLFNDIAERKRAEQHRKLLIQELNHRLKNTLATVRALADQSLRGTDSIEIAHERFEARLFALSRVHEVLAREQWSVADLGEIVGNAMAPFAGSGKPRFRARGPSLRLRPEAALALSMALHELATNAVKYGALSEPDGRVTLSWSVSGGSWPQAHLRWRERGGPPVRAPSRRGFGSRLLERGLKHDLAAKVKLDFEPGGLVCCIDAPLTELAR